MHEYLVTITVRNLDNERGDDSDDCLIRETIHAPNVTRAIIMVTELEAPSEH